MRTTTMPDTAVAEAVGYRSESAFSAVHRNRADVPTLLFALEWQVGGTDLGEIHRAGTHPTRARSSCAHRAAEECAEPRDSAQNIDRDPPRLVPREQLAWQPMIPRKSCLLVDPETGKALGSDE